jgi:hypothetical protein
VHRRISEICVTDRRFFFTLKRAEAKNDLNP